MSWGKGDAEVVVDVEDEGEGQRRNWRVKEERLCAGPAAAVGQTKDFSLTRMSKNCI